MQMATSKVWSVGGLNGPMPEVEFHSFRTLDSKNYIKVFSDRGHGGYSTAQIDIEPFTPETLPPDVPRPSANDPIPTYGKFHGNISIELPKNRPDIERSGYAAWRTVDPQWTLFGKALFNCEAHAYLALRVKSDSSRYFVNLQCDSFVPTDLYQHRLFAKTPGEWETVYIPFADFVKTHLGTVLAAQGDIPKHTLTTIGLGLIDRIPGPFEICIDRIWATNTREFDEPEDASDVD